MLFVFSFTKNIHVSAVKTHRFLVVVISTTVGLSLIASLYATLFSASFVSAEASLQSSLKNRQLSEEITQGDLQVNDLVVTQTHYIDDVRTNLVSNVLEGSNVITVADIGGFSSGQEILLINMQGENVGLYETHYVSNVINNQIYLTNTLINSYFPSLSTVMVQVIPNYVSVIVEDGGILTAHNWNGQTGGVIFVRAQNIIIEENGIVDASGLGYRGGNQDYLNQVQFSYVGESFDVQLGERNQSTNSCGGGGGYNSYGQKIQWSIGSGGGGGHITNGQDGIEEFDGSNTRGYGGKQFVENDLNLLTMGCGGGTGGHDIESNGRYGGSGGNGGGAIFLAANRISIAIASKVKADGFSGQEGLGGYKGGSGAGGSIILEAKRINFRENNLSATGGKSYPLGGNGGNGRIRIDALLITGPTPSPAPYITTLWADEITNLSSVSFTSPTSTIANGSSKITAVVTVRNAEETLSGIPISITTTNANVQVDSPNGFVTDQNGQVQLEFTALVTTHQSLTTDLAVQLLTAVPITLPQKPIITFIPEVFVVNEDQFWTAETVTANALVIADNATVEWSNDTPELTVNSLLITDHAKLILNNTAIITAQSIIVGPNATISATGIYSGSGRGFDALSTEDSGSGAGHGGQGGRTTCCLGGELYDDVYYPIQIGSIGGSTYSSTLSGGIGGGALQFVIENSFDIYGRISVNGTNGETDNVASGGGGSGGSILVTQSGSFNLHESGRLSASGGNSQYGGGGAGGRIAIYTDIYNAAGIIDVSGGSGYQNGEEGSLYLGEVDPLVSTVQISPENTYTSQFAGSSITITALTKDQEPVPNQTVSLFLTDGSASFYASAQEISQTATYIGHTDEQGVVTTTLSAVASGTYQIGIHVGPIPLKPEHPATITFTTALIDGYLSIFEVSEAIVPVDDLAESTALLTVYDENGALVVNKDVQLTTNGNHVTILPPNPITNHEGQATAAIHSADVQTVVLTATIDGRSLNQHPILTFVAGSPSFINSTIIITPLQATANGQDTITIEALLNDEQNRPLANRTIQLSASSSTIHTTNPQITDENGRVSFTVSSTSVGTQTLYLEDLLTSTTIPVIVEFVPGSPDLVVSTLSGDPLQIPADDLTTAVVTATIQDNLGHPIPNEVVTITSTDPLTINQTASQTNLSGIVTATVQSAVIQTATIQALISDEQLPLVQTAVVYFLPTQPDDNQSILFITPTAVIANGIQTIVISGQLTDTFGRTFAQMPLQLDMSGQNNTIAPTQTQTTNSSGRFAFTIASTTAETKAITLTDTTYGTQLTLGTADFLPSNVDAAQSTIEILNPYPVTYANGRETIELLVTARDAYGNPIPHAAVTLDITTDASPNPVIVTQAASATDAAGQLQLSLQSNIPTSARIWIIIDNNLINQFVDVDFALADPNQSTITVVGNDSATADGQELIQLSVTARSSDGIPLPGATVSLTSTAAALGQLGLAPPNTPTNANGRTSGYASSVVNGTYAVFASIDGVVVSNPVNITFKGPDLALQLDAPQSLMAGFPLAYDLTVHNNSGFDATDIVITETLPADTLFVSASPLFTYITNTHQLIGTIDYLTAGAATVLTASIQIPHEHMPSVTLSATGTMAQEEADLSNNTVAFTTTINPPAPILVLETPYPTADIQQNQTGIVSITLRNDGSLPLTNTVIALTGAFPWLTSTAEPFTIPPYGQTHTITLTAAPDALVVPANYLNTAVVSAANVESQTLSIDLHVQAGSRDLAIIAQNQYGERLENAFVEVREKQNIVAPTTTYTQTIIHNAFTDANGRAMFNNFESGREYEIAVTANGYDHLQPIKLTLPAGDLAYTQIVTLTGLTQLVVDPAAIVFFAQPAKVAQETITLHNVGVTTISGLQAVAPHTEIDFAFLGQANPIPDLAPGDSFTFTLNVAPPLTATEGIYRDTLQLTAATDFEQDLPVTVSIHGGAVTTLCVVVISQLLNSPLSNVTVITTEQSGRSAASFQQKHSAQTDEFGQTCFPELPTGPYKIEVNWNGSIVAVKQIQLTYDSSRPVQYEEIFVTASSVDVDWEVTPIELTDQYTTTMLMRFHPDSPPLLTASPREMRICEADNGVITETVTIHNFFPVRFTDVRVGLGYMADQGEITAELIDPVTNNKVNVGEILYIGSILPDADKELLLRAELTHNNACSNESGTVFLRVFADYEHYLPSSWFDLEPSADLIPLGDTAHIPLKLAHTGYPEESNLNTPPPPLENVTLRPPQTLKWMMVSTDTFPLINPYDFVTFTLDVAVPDWLPPGTYRDYILVEATNGTTALIGIEAERTAYGLEVETRFVTPLTTQDESNTPRTIGDAYFADIVGQYNGPTVVRGTTSFINNTWPLHVGCQDCDRPSYHRVNHHLHSLEFTHVGRFEPFGSPGSLTYAPGSGFERRIVILELSQQFSLEREAFLAQLDLRNSLPVSLTDVSVDITISDRLDELREEVIIRTPDTPIGYGEPFILNMPTGTIFSGALSNIPETWMQSSLTNFIMVPDIPTSLPDIQAHDSYMATWTIVPDAMGIVDPHGVDFYVQATINYTPAGQSPAPSIETVPAKITVRPQPLVVLDYFLPTYVLGDEIFNWTVIATNVGQGVARNLHIHTPQPIIINSKGEPVNFTIENENLQDFRIAELQPGESRELVFEIRPEEDGAFSAAYATCEQQNYLGVTLPPLLYCSPTIHWIDTSYLYYASQQMLAKEGCFTTLHQAFSGDPVNTYSGNFTLPETDVSIPAWGLPLQFDRTYNALTQDDPGPLGQGWTHSYHASIEYRPYITRNEAGQLVSENLLSARLPHGSRIYFNVDQNANISPMPGVRAQLTEELGVYTLTQECDQTTYIFENKLFTNPYARPDAVLTAIIDGDGNTTTFTYDPDEGYLTSVIDPSGRKLTFTYIQQNDHWYLSTMTDPLGRVWTYSYTNGYLTAVTAPGSRTTTYGYTAPKGEQPGYLNTITDPAGHQTLANIYDFQGRVIWQDDALGARTTFLYSQDPATGQKFTTIVDPLGRATIETYNALGALESRRDPLGYIESFTYDENFNLITQTDKTGGTTTYAWTDCNCDMSVITDTLGYTITISYDGRQRPTLMTDKLGTTTTLAYGPFTKPTLITDPLGATTTYTYNTHGSLTAVQVPLVDTSPSAAPTTYYGYDAYGNQTAITDTLGHLSTMAYDEVGRLISTTNPLGYTTVFTYDVHDNLIAYTTALTATTVMTYDNHNNMIALRDPLGRVTTYTYNERNELIQLTDALSGTQLLGYDQVGNLISETNQLGQTTVYQYDALNRPLKITNPLSGTTRYQYDPLGRIVAETNANGFTTQYQYLDNTIITVFADGSQLQTTYDAAGNLIELVDAANRIVTYQYDAGGRLITETDPLGRQTHYVYDASGNLISTTDPAGYTTTYQYDALNRLIATTNPLSGTAVMQYDALGNQTALTDALGRTWHYTYDAENRLSAAQNPLGDLTHYTYDLIGNAIQLVDPLGRVTHTSYDALNRPVTVTNPLGQQVSYQYDAASHVTTITDADGRPTSYQYDNLGRTIAATNPLSQTITFAYDALGNQLAQTDAAGRTTFYTYDVLGQQTGTIDALGNATTYQYDAVGNLTTYTDALGRTITYSYNPLDQVLSITNPLAEVMTFTYDVLNRPGTQTDFAGHETHYQYDALGRTLAITNALGYATTFTYDTVGNMLTATDPNGATIAYTYDALDRPFTITDPLSGTTIYTYDAAGNQTTIVQTSLVSASSEAQTTFTYDDLNRLTATTDPLGHTTIFTYNSAGTLTSVQNPLGYITTYTYDDLNRLTHTTDPLGHMTHYIYDVAGNQTAVIDPLGRTVNFIYDALNRPIEINAPLGRTIRYSYDAVGNQISEERVGLVPTHTQTSFIYDSLNRLTAVTNPLGDTITYTYDALGNPLAVTDPLSRTIAYSYDALYQPVTITDPLGQQTSYQYDAAGNQTALTNAAGYTTLFDYDALGRTIRIADPLSGTLSYTYDAAGNLHTTTDAEGRTFTYDYDLLGRLTTATDPLGNQTQHSYDPLGNLIATTDALNRTTQYIYNPLNQLTTVRAGLVPASTDATTTMPGAGTPPTPTATHFTYDAVGNLISQTDPLDRTTTYTLDDLNQVTAVTDPLGNQIHYSYDFQGNVTAITDGSGHTSHLTYDPLGRLSATTNALGDTTTYEYDAAGQNTAVIDPLGLQTSFAYDDLGRLLTITDPLSRTAAYLYDPLGNPLEMIDANGIRTRYSYDPLNRLTAVTENYAPSLSSDHETNVTHHFDYDRVGNLLAMTNPLGNIFTFGYDELNRMTTTADPLGNTFAYSFDPVSNLTSMVDANGQTTQLTYDTFNRVTTVQRPDETITFTYDQVGNRLRMSDNIGQTSYVYDELGRLTQVTDPFDQVVRYGYDAVGNRTQLTYPTGQVVTYTYDVIDRLTQVTDWSGGQTTYEYDANSRLTNMALPNNVIGTFGFDDAHQLTDITYTHLTRTLAAYTYTYDAVGNRTQATERVATPTELPIAEFTAASRVGTAPLVVTFTNETINAQSLLWEFGDGTSVDDVSRQIVHTYSEPGTYTVTLTAASSEFTHVLTRPGYIVVLDDKTLVPSDGLLVVEAEGYAQNTFPAAHYWTSSTALAGFTGENYLQIMPDNGTTFEFATTNVAHTLYLPLLAKSGPAALDPSPDQIAHIQEAPELRYNAYFNEAGLYTVWVRGAAVDNYSGSVHVGLSDEQHVTLSDFAVNAWTWSAEGLNGQTAVLEIPEPGRYTIHVWAREDGFQFDRLILSKDSAFVPAGTGPKLSPRAKQYSGEFTVSSYHSEQQYSYYDGQLAGALQTFSIWNTILANLGMLFMAPLSLVLPWAYRTRRKKLAQYVVMFCLGFAFVSSGAGLVWGATPVETIKAQANKRVVLPTAAFPAASEGLPLNIINYQYDPLYRLTSAAYHNGSRFTYTYDAAGNRLSQTAVQTSLMGASEGETSPAPTETATYTYDAANRLTSRNGIAYTYDNNGNLLNDGGYNYSYDSANRLKTMQDVAAVSLTSYAYNGDGVRVLQNMDGLDTHYVQDVAAALPRVLSSKEGGTYNLSLWGVGLIGEQRGGSGSFAAPAAWQFSLPDALGSVRQLTDTTGGLALAQSYDPFGNILSSAGAGNSQYGFTGEEQAESGHLYLRARTYDPANGRFLQQDTVFGNPAAPRTLHRYAYGFNNPVNYTDPSGRMPTQGGHALPLQSTAGRSAATADQAPNTGAGRGLGKIVDARAAALSRGEFSSIQGSGCFLDGILGFLQETAIELLDFAMNTVKMLESMTNIVRDPTNWRQHLDQTIKHGTKVYSFLKEHKTVIAQLLVSLTPLDTLSDLFTAVTGYDIWTGEKVSWQERITAGLFAALDIVTGGFGDDVLQAAETMAKIGGAVKGTAKLTGKMAKGVVVGLGNLMMRGVRGLVNMGLNLGQMLLKSVDDLLQVMRRSAGDLLNLGRRQIDTVDNLARGVLKGSDNAVLEEGQAALSKAARHVDADGKWADDVANGSVCTIDNSFTAETTVETEDGAIAIENIEIGDRVLGEDSATGEQGYFAVVALTEHPTDKVVQVTIQVDEEANDGDVDGQQTADRDDDEGEKEGRPDHGRVEVMNVTHEHPIYVEGAGWIHADNLEIGDRLRLADGGMAKVLSIDQADLDEPQSVYNFTVRGPHTYFVLESQLLVHNCSSAGSSLDNYSPSESAEIRQEVIDGLTFDEVQTIAFRVLDGNQDNFAGHVSQKIQDLVARVKQSGKLQDLQASLMNISHLEWDFSPEGLAYLEKQMVNRVGDEDIQTLALGLGIDYEDLGSVKTEAVSNLLKTAQQNGLLKDLQASLSKRISLDWDFSGGNLSDLHQQMMKNMDLNEIRTAAFDLNFDLDDFGPEKDQLITGLLKNTSDASQQKQLSHLLQKRGITWNPSDSPADIYDKIKSGLSISEIHDVAFDVGVNLPQNLRRSLDNKPDYLRALLMKVRDEGRMNEFIREAQKINPAILTKFGH